MDKELKRKLDCMFNPRSVAVIGASSKEGQFSNNVVKGLSQGTLRDHAYPVNPNLTELCGLKCYKRVADIPEKVDLAYIAVPAAMVPGIMQECVEAGVEGCVIYTSGFAEVDSAGRTLQDEVVRISRQGGVRIIGPNCIGISNLHAGLGTGVGTNSRVPGRTAVISHSGSLCGSITGMGYERGLRFSKTVSCGNRADIDTVDLLEYFGQDEDTSLILMYLEGVEDGRALMRVLSQVTEHKPVLIWKGGRTSSGARAASSHSAALAGVYDVFRAAVTQSGAVVCSDIEDLLDKAIAFQSLKSPAGNRIGVVSGPGGPAVAAADACDEQGLVFSQYSDSTIRGLREFLPPFGSPFNPVDLTTAVILDMTLYSKAMDVVVKDPNADMLLVLGPAESRPEDFGRTIVEGMANWTAKPFAVSLIATSPTYLAAQEVLGAAGVPFYPTPYRAASSLRRLQIYGDMVRRRADSQSVAPEVQPVGRPNVTVTAAQRRGQSYLTEYEAMTVLESYGIPVVQRIHATSVEDCQVAARKLGYPVAVKVSSPDIVHKTDSGGVVLNIVNEKGLEDAFHQVTQAPLKAYPEARIEGVLVEKQVKPVLELGLGFVRDSQFGPVIMLSLGGIFIEVFRDVSMRVGPLDFAQAMAMIDELKASAILEGFRGVVSGGKESLARIILAVDALARQIPEISELDVNPLAVTGDGFIALDARMKVVPIHGD